ncbi:MAG: radical SAM/SPASM domain-containing protein [Humidesulfovibrio sp.]|uniref:radical SAM protein n=1 Tax=Humidesulfovibrio sp. TaxID=2910988 RepID=UPI0027F1FAA4|nr:radical SAM/SPASM domain-containing protein [Humidesulfovibrio sp.]MDQ7834257.1 radical SAM/SPASM domain-containing protein [Humidesulfovibrio sp.]
MEFTNRKWQNHLKAKGLVAFLLDRVSAHARSSQWQHKNGSFHFPIADREVDDALSRAYFELNENFPTEVYVEVTSRCNLDCLMCARSRLSRATGDMDMALFKKIMDEIALEYREAYVHFYGIGDPLMDETIFEKLAYAKQVGLNNTIIFTNGQNLLKNDNYKKLVLSNVPILGVDVDGFTRESYEKIRRGGSFELLLKSILTLKQHLDESPTYKRLELAYQVYPGINDAAGEMQDFASWCEKYTLEYKFVTLHTWGDLRADVPMSSVAGMAEPNDRSVQRTGPCCSLWSPMILNDGRVSPCFLDANGNGALGDMNKSSLKSIWQGAHRALRAKQVQGVFSGTCQDCASGSCVDLPPFRSSNYPPVLRDNPEQP